MRANASRTRTTIGSHSGTSPEIVEANFAKLSRTRMTLRPNNNESGIHEFSATFRRKR
jgi:hypothetical protein